MYGEVFRRHEKVALQFSGGKDSLAVLYVMQPYWDRLTVYWLNTGDVPRETHELMAFVRNLVPNFIEVTGYSQSTIQEFGWPSDVVPIKYTRDARLYAGHDTPFLVQDRYACCYRSIMAPLHRKMKDDGITLIIRGQRADETPKGPLESGDVLDGIEFLFPIQHWQKHHVLAYLTDNVIPIPEFYDAGGDSIDCLHCSAYWEHNTQEYLSAKHPTEYNERERRITLIKRAIASEIIS